MWELNYNESWAPKDLHFQTVVLEKTVESALVCKEIQPVNPKGSQSWIFTRRTDAEAEAPILWPPDVKSWFTGKDPNAGEDWGQENKGITEDEIDGWMGITKSMDMSLSKLREIVMDREAWRSWGCRVGLSDWKTTTAMNIVNLTWLWWQIQFGTNTCLLCILPHF